MRRLFTTRRLLPAVTLTVLVAMVVVLLCPVAGLADTLGNISPAAPGPAGGWMGRYPISRYQIDQYFPAVSVSLLSGVDVSGLLPMMAYGAAQVIWLITAFVSYLVITVFQFAFNLNLLTGEDGGVGALAPISQAIHEIYTSTFGAPWLIAAITAVGIWAMWRALVQRRYTQTATAVATSMIYCIVALGIVARPAETITPLSRLSNQMSQAFLSLSSRGTVSEGAAAESAGTGQLFQMLILNPWTVLEFGGLEHCVNTQNHTVAVQPLSRSSAENSKLALQLEQASEVQAESKTCVNNREKYAAHFLAYSYQSAGRNAEYEALKAGDTSKLPSSDPGKGNGSYKLGPADRPAAQAAGKGGQFERLLISLLLFAGELGMWVLLAGLAAGVILAQILLLLLLAFAPVALIAAVFPGHGHAYFVGWVTKMLGYLARKAAYSLVLAILLAVCRALQDATSSLGWLISFLLQAVFCWTVLTQRRQLTSGLLVTLAGSNAREEQGAGKLQTLYYATRLAQMMRGRKEPAPSPQPASKPQLRLDPGRGSSTQTSRTSRPAPSAATSTTSQPGQSSRAGRHAGDGASTPTGPTPTPPPIDGFPPPEQPDTGVSSRAGRTRSQPAPRSSSTKTSRPAAASSTSTRPRTGSTTQTSRPQPRSATATATSQPQRPATRSSTSTPAPPRRSPAAQPSGAASQSRPAVPAAATTSTSTSARSRGGQTSNTTTPAFRGGSKETK
jgi:hypothetical protein